MKKWCPFQTAVLLTLLAAPAQPGAWVLPGGQSWLQLKLMRQDTTERYFLEGERIPFFFDGRSRTTAVFLDYQRGLLGGLEARVQLPLFKLRFDDIADDRTSTGIGDVRAGLRWGLVRDPVVATVGVEVKFPTGEFENDVEVVPVGEGQFDYELTLELGRSLWPRPGYVTGLVGYRLRTLNEQNGIDYGNELIWSFEAGYDVRRWVTLKVLARGLHGGESTLLGFGIPTLRREAVYIEPGLIFKVGASQTLELSVPFTVRGRNWPAGPVLSIGFARRF